MPIFQAGKPSNQQGMTLLEAVVVICLMTIMIGIAAPQAWQMLYKTPLQRGVEQVQSIVQQGVAFARLHQQKIVLQVQRDVSVMRLLQGSKQIKRVELPSGVAIGALYVPERQVEELTAEFSVYPSGVIDEFRIFLAEKLATQTVHVLPFRGVTVVEDGHISFTSPTEP